MARMTEEERQDLAPVVSGAAHQLARRYSSFTTARDIEQDMWVWLLESGKRWRFVTDSDEEHDRKQALSFLEKNLLRFGERQCREEKARVSGYRHTDEYFYTSGLIIAVMEATHNGVSTLGEPTGEKIRRTRTLSEGGDVDAMKADVEIALSTLDKDDRYLLHSLYAEKRTSKDMADELGVTRQAVERRSSRLMDKLIVSLGGDNPWRH
jgi:DNA-directed RNA polymerase specialized sigma24 family protein